MKSKIIFSIAAKEYHVDCTNRNFQDSKKYCSDNGYTIASFHSYADTEKAKSKFQSSSCNVAYIGAERLRDVDGTRRWKWLDHSAWDFVYKSNNHIEPYVDETVIAWNKNDDMQGWQDWGQGQFKLGVICQKTTGILHL